MSFLAAFGAGQAPMLLLAGAISLLASSWLPTIAIANTTDEQICDAKADYFLGIENFDETIRLHHEVLKKHPDNALAHYLSFLKTWSARSSSLRRIVSGLLS